MPPMFVAKSSRGFAVDAMMFRAAMWKTRLLAGHELVDERLIRHRALDELGARRDGLGPAGEQVVEDGDAAPGVDEPSSHGRTDEPGAAGDEDPPTAERALRRGDHRLTPVRRRRAGRNSRHQSFTPRIFV